MRKFSLRGPDRNHLQYSGEKRTSTVAMDHLHQQHPGFSDSDSMFDSVLTSHPFASQYTTSNGAEEEVHSETAPLQLPVSDRHSPGKRGQQRFDLDPLEQLPLPANDESTYWDASSQNAYSTSSLQPANTGSDRFQSETHAAASTATPPRLVYSSSGAGPSTSHSARSFTWEDVRSPRSFARATQNPVLQVCSKP